MTKFRGASILLLLLRLALGGVLIYSGISKVHGTWTFAETIANFRLLPAQANQFIAVILPWCEIVCGLLLAVGVWVRAGALVSLAMFAVFAVAVISAIARGLDTECGCFGTESRAGWHTLGVDSLGLLASLLVLWLATRFGRPVPPEQAVAQK